MMNKSDWEIPGPPLRGTLSPPATSIWAVSAELFDLEQYILDLLFSCCFIPLPAATHNVDDVISKLAGIVGSKVVSAALDEQQLALKLGLQLLERVQVGGNVLADSSMRASTWA
jgi:hypothetical protein